MFSQECILGSYAEPQSKGMLCSGTNSKWGFPAAAALAPVGLTLLRFLEAVY